MKTYIRKGRSQISSFLNCLLHEYVGFTPAIILMILFCKADFFLPLAEPLPKLFNT
jgi:hypothetical protein